MTNEIEQDSGPRWSRLYATAAAQDGYFTTAQAAEAGYYPQLLRKHLSSGRVARVRRGVYRLVHFPPGDHEDLVVVWLWSDRVGVFSHSTALVLHELSDILPSKIHLTLPVSWRPRRLKIPAGIVLHFDDIDETDRTWLGPVRITTPARTVIDCATAGLPPDLMQQAIDEGLSNGLFTRPMIAKALEYMSSFETSER